MWEPVEGDAKFANCDLKERDQMNWKKFGKGLLLAAGLGAVWGVLTSVLDLETHLGAAYQVANTAVIVGGTIWFVRFVKAGDDLSIADDEGAPEDEG